MKPNKLRIGDLTFAFAHLREFLYLYFEIFLRNEYGFQPDTVKPFIIDCGAHQGLSILFFKKKFPQSKILAFEPDPQNLSILKKNIASNKLKNVKVVEAAVGKKNARMVLYSAGARHPSWGNTIDPDAARKSGHVQKKNVQSLRLSQHMGQKVDLLKMDIEGAELEVVQEIEKKLPLIRELVIETHSREARQNISRLLEKRGFQTSFRKPRRIILGELTDRVLGKERQMELGILRASRF